MDLLQEQRTVPPGARADAADYAHDHRQDHELPGMDADIVARDWHQIQQLADKELAADDIEQARDRHHRNANHDPPEVQVGRSEERQ